MNTKGEIISRLRMSIKELSSDTNYSNRYLWNVFSTASKVLIQRDADQKRKIYKTNDIWENICIELEPVSPILCSCLSLPMDSTIYRSVFKIPRLMESSFGALYRTLSTVDNSRQITLVSPLEYQIKSNLRYNKGYYAFLHDDYLWSNVKYPTLMLSAIFEGETCAFKCGTEPNCVECNKGNNDLNKLTITYKSVNKCVSNEDGTTGGSCNVRLTEPANTPDYLVDSAVKMALQEVGATLQKPLDNHPNASESQKEMTP